MLLPGGAAMMRARYSWISGLLLFAVLATGAPARAQEKEITRKEVPEVVLAAFAKAYPKATILGYTTEVENGQRIYEIESTEGKTHRDVTYTTDGKVISVEESLEFSKLPAPVRAAFEKKFPGAKTLLAERVTKAGAAAPLFELHFEYEGKELEIVYDAKGIEQKS